MFSPGVLQDFKLFMKLSSSFCAVPFDWDPENKMLKLSRRPIRYLAWIFSLLFELVYTLNLWSSLCKGIFREEREREPARIALDLMVSVGMITSTGSEVPLLQNLYQFPEFVWQLMNLNSKSRRAQELEMKPRKTPGFGKKMKEAENLVNILIIRLSIVISATFPVFMIGLFLHNPGHPRYLLHRIPASASLQKNKAVILLFASAEFLMIFRIVLLFYTNVIAIVLWTTSTNQCLERLILETPKRPNSNLNLNSNPAPDPDPDLDIKRDGSSHPQISARQIPSAKKTIKKSGKNLENGGEKIVDISLAEKVKLFKELRILSQMSNSCFSPLVWPTYTFMVVFFSAYGLYGTIKLHNLVPLHIFLIFPLSFLSMVTVSGFLYPLVGSMFPLSQHFISFAGMKVNSGDKHGRRVVRSMRRFGCKMGNIKIIKMSFLHMILWISNLTINAILLY